MRRQNPGASAEKAAPSTDPTSRQEQLERRKLEDARKAADILKRAATESRESEKARAAQKVKELRARLQMLKMIFAGDPDRLARVAAAIARELAAAVQSYRSAGGQIDGGGGEAQSPPSEGAGVDSVGQPAANAEALMSAGTKAPMATGKDGSEPAEKAVDKREGPEAPAAADARRTEGGNRRPGPAGTPGRDAKDAEFAAEARDLARQLKALLRRRKPATPDDGERSTAEMALTRVDQTLGALPVVIAADP